MISLSCIGLVLMFFFVFVWFYLYITTGFSRIFPITKSEDKLTGEGGGGFGVMPDGISGTLKFREGWITVNGISSHVLTWGGWLEDPLPGDSVLIFMCGVPGITLFYQSFLEALHTRLQIPVWTICVAGHELPPATTNLQLPKDTKLYNSVEAQIAHKKEFVNKFIPDNKKIYFVGHSFGAKMVIELLKSEQISCRTQKCFLLMPTIERFSDIPRAKFWLKCVNSGMIYTVVFLTWLLYCMPVWGRRLFSYFYFYSRGLHRVNSCCVQAMVEFCNPTVFYNVRCLVWNELETIKQLDTEVLSDMTDRIKVFFAPKDQWAPLTHCDSLKSAVPGLSVEVLDDRFEHAFTLATAEDMADIIVNDLETELLQSGKKLGLEIHNLSQSITDLTKPKQPMSDLKNDEIQFLNNMYEWIQ